MATPPPKQSWIIAITGCGVATTPPTRYRQRVVFGGGRRVGADRPNSMSALLMNACSPAPRRRITRMSPSRASDSIATASPSQTAALRALRACGRFTTTQASGGSRLTIKASASVVMR
jgi:hypothetical protein